MDNLIFEKFTATGSKSSYTISLNKAGGFSFNAGFFRKHSLEKLPYVVLYFVKKNKAVGFYFSKEQIKGAFKLSNTQNSTASVRPNSFMRSYGIKQELYSGKYEPKKGKGPDGEDIFYIILERKK